MVSRQIDKDKIETRVYKYGLVPLGDFPKEAISELWRANKLWNNLVKIHNENRADYEKALCAAHVLYSEIAEKLVAINEKIDQAYDEKRNAHMQAETRDPADPLIKKANAIIKAHKDRRREIYSEMKSIKIEADSRIDKKTLSAKFNESVNEASRVKNTGGLYNVTAFEVQTNFKNARERSFNKNTGGALRFHSFDGTGFFAFRFRRKGAKVDGISFEELFTGNTPNEQRFAFDGCDDARKKPRIRLRATLASGRSKASRIQHEFDLTYHRPIPENSKIQNGKIMRIRVGDKFKYHLVLTVKQPLSQPVSIPKNIAIGIDINFRRKQNGNDIRVAMIASSNHDQPSKKILLPIKMIKGMEHITELRSILDDAAAKLGKVIKPVLNDNPIAQDHPEYRLWRAAARFPKNVTLAFETAYKLARWLKHDPDFIPAEASEPVLSWWVTYSRKYRELHNVRAKQLLHRKHFYRQVAYDLVAQKQLIALEEINLAVLAEIRNRDNKLKNNARTQRVLASLSEFRNAIINAAKRESVPYIKVPPQYTSKRCGSCQKINEDLRSEEEWTCPHCGTVHDHDENAARNIAELGRKIYFADGKTGGKG